MREIKFMFWHTKERVMSRAHGLGVIWEYLCEEWGGAFDWKDVEKRQYTGFKDKNGTEIYEGDILKSEYESLYPVVYDAPTFTIEGYDNGDWYHGQDAEYHRWDSFQVIGNIYENPDLLP